MTSPPRSAVGGASGADDEETKVLTQLCCSRSCDGSGRSKVIVALEG